jgi:opacity protein-like surface antigen
MFFTQRVHAWKRLLGGPTQGVIVQGRAAGQQYPDLDRYNQLYVSAGLLAYGQAADGWQLEGGLDGDYASVESNNFSTSGSASAAVRWRQRQWARANLGYRLSLRDFLYPTTAEEDHDGLLHTVTLSQDLILSNRQYRLHVFPYLEAGCEDSQGDSSEHDFWGAGAGARLELAQGLTVFASGGYRERDYRNAHVRTGFEQERDDDQWRVGAGASYDITPNLQVSITWGYTDNDSSMPEWYAYDQHTVSAALTLSLP